MPSDLRPIAVHVEAPPSRAAAGGGFEWVLTEREAGADGASAGGRSAWTEIDRARAPAATYQEAMAQGLVALEALIDDLDAGPRRSRVVRPAPRAQGARDDDDTQDGRDAPAADAGRKAKKPARPSLFGFGPAV